MHLKWDKIELVWHWFHTYQILESLVSIWALAKWLVTCLESNLVHRCWHLSIHTCQGEKDLKPNATDLCQIIWVLTNDRWWGRWSRWKQWRGGDFSRPWLRQAWPNSTLLHLLRCFTGLYTIRLSYTRAWLAERRPCDWSQLCVGWSQRDWSAITGIRSESERNKDPSPPPCLLSGQRR